jgi:hypothetical protein
MTTLLQSARWQYAGYYQPELFDKSLSVAGVDASLKFLPLETLIVFPGSRSGADWWHDAEALVPYTHPVFGEIPYGFALGMDDIFPALKALIPHKPVRFVGHSLGCPHALYQAGLLLHDGTAPDMVRLTGFEPPRSVTQKGKDLLALIKDMVLTRNSDAEGDSDIVLDMPSWAMHARELTQIGSEPITGNIIIDKEIHAIQAVMVSCELLEAQNAQ